MANEKKKGKNKGASHKLNKKKFSKKCRSNTRTSAAFVQFQSKTQQNDSEQVHQQSHQQQEIDYELALGAIRDYSTPSQFEIYIDWKNRNSDPTKRLKKLDENGVVVYETREDVEKRGTVLGRKGGLSLPLIIPTGEQVKFLKLFKNIFIRFYNISK
jgi:hypothetical protein